MWVMEISERGNASSSGQKCINQSYRDSQVTFIDSRMFCFNVGKRPQGIINQKVTIQFIGETGGDRVRKIILGVFRKENYSKTILKVQAPERSDQFRSNLVR